MIQRFLDPQDNEDEIEIKSIRPKSLEEIIGREKEKQALMVLIKAAKERDEAIDHILLHGPPGLGKTSFAHVIANELGTAIYVTSGPSIDKKGDLASILTNIESKGVLFIDEIHRLNKNLEEILYSAMEDRTLNIVIGKGPSARTLKVDLNDFTVIGATTRIAMLSSPLRDRFGLDLHLDFYDLDEIELLLHKVAKMFSLKLSNEVATEIAKRSRRTPRLAIRILKRIRDLAQLEKLDTVNLEVADKAFSMIGIDGFGLDKIDRKILTTIVNNFHGGPVGLNTIAAAIGEDVNTIQDVYEPFLLREGFINRSPRGRVTTEKAVDYISHNVL